MKYFSTLFLILSCSFLSFAQMPTVTATGKLMVPRWLHESQLLPNGKVLAFGGNNGDYVSLVGYNSAELYNPATGTWSYTGSMQLVRQNFASVVLNNGNVLAIGGEDADYNSTATCEIYNTATGTWTSAASMQQARRNHDAVLLRNGKVLVAGSGYDNSRCELYDPSSNTWSYTGSLNVVHGESVSMVMLSDGRVLLTGGTAATGSNIGEIYDPQTESWTQITSKLNKNRNSHTSILLNDGRVLIVGSGTFSFQDQISTEYYYPPGNYFTSGSNMVTNVGHSEMALLDNGNVLVYSIGDIFSPTDTKALQMYNVSTGNWSSGAYNFVGANWYTIHRLHTGKILIVGGSVTTGNGANQHCALISQSGYNACLSPNLSLNVTGGTVCTGKDFALTLPNSETDVTYQAYLPSGIAASAPVSGGGSISLNIPNTYLTTGLNVFTIKVQKSGCVAYYLTNTATVNVQQQALSQPIITASGPVSFCSGSNVTLTSSAGSSYLWSNGATTQSITISQSGIFSVRVADANGCASPASASVSTLVYPATISAGTNENTCQNKPAYQLTGNTPLGGTWSGTGVSPEGIFNPAAAGPGSHTLTYSLCGKTATKVITVTATPTIADFSIKAEKDSVCQGRSTYFQVIGTSASAYYQIRIGSTDVGNGNYGNGGTLTLPSVYPSTTTVYTIRGNVSNSCGVAEILKEYTITVVPNPTAHVVVTADTICTKDRVTFKIANSNPVFKYRVYDFNNSNGAYYKGNGDTLVLVDPKSKNNDVNKFTSHEIQATNILGCSTVTVFKKQIYDYENKANFIKQPAYITGEPISLINTSTGDTYKWTFDASASITSSQSKTPPNFSYSSVGPKKMELISTSRFGCSDTISKSTYIHTAAAASVGKSCYLDTITTIPLYKDSKDYNGILDLHVDSHNNTYVAGYYYTHDGVGGYSGAYSFYLQKFDSKGNLLWQHKQNPFDYTRASDYYHTFITAISTDANDNVYITGSYSNLLFKMAGLTSSTLNYPRPQTFIMKLNAAGVGQWMIHGTNDEYLGKESGGTDILYVDDNHIYVSVFQGKMLRFPDGTTQNFDKELTILHLDKNGKLKKSFTNSDYYNANGISMSLFNPDVSTYYTQKIATVSPKMQLSENGKLFLAGKIRATITFGSKVLTPTVVNYNGYIQPTGYIAQLDTASGWQNAFLTHAVISYGSNYGEFFPIIVPKVAIDNQNNVYIADSYRHSPGFEATNKMSDYLKASITLANGVVLGDTSGSFIGKYDPNGNLLWYNHNPLSYPVGLTYLKASDDVITFGTFDNVYYGQTSQGSGSKAIRSSGGSDCFISSLGSNGNLKWMDKLGSTQNDKAFMMTTNACNDLTLLGKFKRRGGIKTDSLIYSNDNLFLARYTPNGSCSVVCNPTDTPLKVSIYSVTDYKSNTSPIPVTVKFTRNVTGFNQSDLIVTNGTVSGFTGSGSIYTFNITPAANGTTVTAKILAGAATDGTMSNLASNIFSMGYDNVKPGITLSTTTTSTDYFKNNTLVVNINATETLLGFTESDLQLSNCTIYSFSGSGSSYTATLIPVKEGNVSVFVPQGMAADSANNSNTASNVLSKIYDITNPKVVITTTATTPTATSPIPLTITFSEPVQPFSINSISISLNGPTVSDLQNPSGDMKTFTANINCTSTTFNSVSVSSGYVSDLAGNTNEYSNSLKFEYNIDKPSVYISSTSPLTTSVSPIPVTLNFSKNIFGLTESDFIVTNGTVTNLTGKGNNYTLQLVPTASGTVSLQLPGGVVEDTVGNTNTASSTLTRTYDNDKPTVVVASVRPNPTNTTPIPVTFTFSENVTGFTVADVVVTNGTLAGFTGSGKSYSVNVTPIIQGTVTVKVNADAAQDVSLNGNAESNTYFTKFDNIKPTVTITSTITGPTRENVIPVTITLSDEMEGFSEASLTPGNVTFANFAGSGLVYTVDLIPTKIGLVGVTVNNNKVIDAAGNGNNSASYSVTYQGDDYTKPTVVISTTATDPTASKPIPFKFTWSENVSGFASGDVTVTNGTISTIFGDGINFTANVTPTTGGPVTLQVKPDAATDNALNTSIESEVFTIMYDNIRPTATFTSTSSNPTTDATIPVTITFSETITGLTISDFTVSNGFVKNLTGSGLVHTIDLIPASPGTVTMTLIDGAVADIAGGINLATSFTTVFNGTDGIKPVLTISSTASAMTNLSAIPVTFKFTESVTGFTAADIQVSNGTLSNFTGSGINYSATIVPSSQGTISIAVAADAAQDAANNSSEPASFSIIYDNIKPTFTITSEISSPTSNTEVPIVITFSEEITGFTLADFSVSNGTVTNLSGSGSGTVFTATLNPIADGLVTININSAVLDMAGNVNLPGSFNITYKQAVINQPSVEITSAFPVITNQSKIPLTFTFSEDVTGFIASDVQINSGTLSGFTGSGRVYTATLTPTYQGTVTITIPANAAQNSLSNGNVSSFFSLIYDSWNPSTTITSTIYSPTSNATIPITITFTESVTGLSLDDFTVNNGSLSNLSGSGTAYTATLSPAANGTVSVSLKASSVTDAAGNHNIQANFSIVYNGTVVNQPTLEITSGISGSTNLSAIPLTFTFSENVTGFIASDVQVTNGAISGFTGSGSIYTATLTPASQGTITITVAANAAQNSLSNGNLSSYYSLIFDSSKPTATITSTVSSPTSSTSIPVTITFSENVTGLSLADFTVSNGILSNLSGTGTAYTATLSPAANGTVSVSLNASSVTDAAGNFNNAASFNIVYNGSVVNQPTLEITSTVTGATNQSSIPVTFTFSESVSGFTASDIIINNGTLTGFSGSGGVYTAMIIPSSQGPISVTVPSGVAQNGSSNGNTTANFDITYDTVKPTAAITSTSSNPTSDLSIPITITFSEDIKSLSLSDLIVSNGTITNLTGSGSTYTAFLIPDESGEVSITLNSNYVMDIAGNTANNSNFSIVYNKQTTGLWDALVNKVQIYPNPSVGLVTINSPIPLTEAEVSIITTKGIVIHKETINSSATSVQFDFSFIPNGVYDIQIKNTTTVVNQLLIIQH